MSLHDRLAASVLQHPSRTAVMEADGTGRTDYAHLDRLSDRLRDRLASMGVGRGDRVGLYLRKSVDTVASIFGVLKTGAAYVPVDPTAPATRNAYIHNNCRVKAVVVEKPFAAAYCDALRALGPLPPLIVVDACGGGHGLENVLTRLDTESPARPSASAHSQPGDLAYVLYTSGSTGTPKGVMLSHDNALAFVDWAAETFVPRADDVFSSHAPFHFDLSILDIYLPLAHGAALVLIPEHAGKDPMALSRIITDRRITVWYSAPSILSLLAQFGRIADYDYSSLRTVLFAGEVFPIVHLRSFKRQVPAPRYFNLYGPTETNVCTWYEIPEAIPDDRTAPYPIGRVCSNLLGRVVDLDGRDVPADAEGELCIAGPNVMRGYWELPEQTAACFLPGSMDGTRWYRTGDIVSMDADANYRYVGRRDRMIKKRGYRVELGEIEVCLYRHSSIREAAVVALADEAGVQVKAHLSFREARASIVELKTFCSKHLPLYMVPDSFAFHESLPKTSTDKIDYVSLANLR